MKTYTPDELKQVLNLHALWLRNDSAGCRANLAGAYLAGAYLAGANLADAYLAGANLAGAYLAGANLAGANLADAYLADAYLAGAYLADANLAGAYLAGANLADAYLADANLARANLAGANLAGANLAGALYAFASVSFLGHGVCGRTLTALRRKEGDAPELFCGCFTGNTEALRQYIAGGPEKWRRTRTLALDTVLMLLDTRNEEDAWRAGASPAQVRPVVGPDLGAK